MALRGTIQEINVLKIVLWLSIGLLGASSVFLDAWFSHGLTQQVSDGLMTESQLSSLKTAVDYQQFNSVIMVLALILAGTGQRLIQFLPCLCFLLGTLAFSGGIYGKHLLELSTGALTPVGGIIMALGWILLAIQGLRRRTQRPNNPIQ